MAKYFQTAGSNLVKIGLGIVLGAVILFLVQNWGTLTDTSIRLQWLVAAEKPLWFWLALSFLGGAILAYGWALKGRFKMAKTHKETNKKLQELLTQTTVSEPASQVPTNQESNSKVEENEA